MRTFVGFPNYDFRSNAIPHSDERPRNYVLEVRNRLRTLLDPEGTHQFWVVSDIAEWQPTIEYDGYGFVVFHRDGDELTPVNTGPAWLFLFPGDYYAGLIDPDDFLQANQIVNYFRNSFNSSTTITTNGNPLIHYCETGGTTTPYNGGWDSDGALVGGDLSLPAIDPLTNLPGFMPGTTFLYGTIMSFLNDNTSGNKWASVWDHDNATAVFYVASGLFAIPHNVVVMGEIIAPFSSNDTRKSGVARWAFNAATEVSDAVTTYQSCWAYNEAGTRTEYTVTAHNKFARKFPDSTNLLDGVWPWDPLLLISTNHFKGWFEDVVVREVPALTGSGRVIGEFYKAGSNLIFMYGSTFPANPRGD